jgi:hypothetical protein
MPVLGTVGDEEEQAGRRQAIDEPVQKCLRLGVDPMEVFDNQEYGLNLALLQQQPLQGLQGALTALRGVERLPGGIFDRHL